MVVENIMNKRDINKEIEEIKDFLNEREDIDPDYISPELKNIQSYVLLSHARLERGMDYMILWEIRKNLKKINKDSWYKTRKIVDSLLDHVGYRNKVEIISNYNDLSKQLVNSLNKVNKYRIEFAHPKGYSLRDKYNYNNPRGKQNIRDLLRCLKIAEERMDNYWKTKEQKQGK